MIKVFTNEYAQDMKRRYQQKPEHEKRDLYKITLSNEGQYLRAEIEEMVAALSPDKQRVVIPRLRTEDNFKQTYNELAVGCQLRGCLKSQEDRKKAHSV